MPDNPFTISSSSVKSGDLRGKYRREWVEEAIDFEEGDSGLTISHTPRYVGSSITNRTLTILLALFVLGIGIIFTRLFYLQVYKGSYYRSLAEGNRIRLQPIPSERGIIYDRNNVLLVQNIPGFSLTVSTQDLPRAEDKRAEVIKKIVEISGVPEDQIQQLIKKYGLYSQTITIKENLDYDTALKLYIENANLPGVKIESSSERKYVTVATSTQNSVLSLSHILGYVSKIKDDELNELRGNGYLIADKIGRTGLEKTYETYLRGTYGRKKIEVNAVGREQSQLAVEAPVPGKNVVLTIDLEGQKKLEDLVEATAEKTGKRRISAIAMNPENGEIIAMVSWPSFDNNKFSQGIDQASYDGYIHDKDLPLFNRAIGGSFPPGSTAKLMVSAAALQENIVTRYTTVNSVGGILVGGTLFKDWKAGGHGTTDVTKALAWSVNTFFYYVGGGYEKFMGLGVERMMDYMRAFNVAAKTGIDIPGESTGFLPSKEWKKQVKNEPWYVGDTYNLSIGQGDMLVSPLQVALWTAIVASNGKIVTPHFGKEVVNPKTKQVTELTFPINRLDKVSPENLGIVRDGMRECVTDGSCKLLQTLPFLAAGKTGTAQWNKNKPTHAWFTSFAPFKNPQLVVTVLVEEGGEGSTVAMPIARDFLDWWGRKYLKK